LAASLSVLIPAFDKMSDIADRTYRGYRGNDAIDAVDGARSAASECLDFKIMAMTTIEIIRSENAY